MYRLWIINSVNKTIANEVLVYYLHHEIVGFITLGIKNKVGKIGIIAVDKNFRGQGIGKALVLAAENWSINHSCNSLQVVTQGSNKPACALYEHCKYEIKNSEWFYHIWNNQLP